MSHSVQTNSGFGLGINDPRRAWYFVDISPRLVQGISTPKGQNRKISAFHFSLLSILITHSLIFHRHTKYTILYAFQDTLIRAPLFSDFEIKNS